MLVYAKLEYTFSTVGSTTYNFNSQMNKNQGSIINLNLAKNRMKGFLQCMIIDSHKGMHDNTLKVILMADRCKTQQSNLYFLLSISDEKNSHWNCMIQTLLF